MRERIKQVIDREGMSQSQFADFIEVNRPTLSHILAGRNNPSLEVVMKIHQKFPKISTSWLLDGTGSYDADGATQDASDALAPEAMTDVATDELYLQPDASLSSVAGMSDDQPKSRFIKVNYSLRMAYLCPRVQAHQKIARKCHFKVHQKHRISLIHKSNMPKKVCNEKSSK